MFSLMFAIDVFFSLEMEPHFEFKNNRSGLGLDASFISGIHGLDKSNT